MGGFFTLTTSPALIGVRRLYVDALNCNTTILARICSNASCLENACCPKPFIYSCYICHYFFPNLFVLVHCDVDTSENEAFNDVHSEVDTSVAELSYRSSVYFPQHPIYLSAFLIFVSDTHTEARIVLSDKLLDMPQAVMPTVGTICFQAEST